MEFSKAFIFDFDGTICDSGGTVAFEIIKALSSRFRLRKLQEGDAKILYNLSSLEAIRFMNVSPWKLPFVVRQARKEFAMRIGTIQAVRGMPEVIYTLRKTIGVKVGILTSNATRNVHAFLQKENIEVDFVQAGSSVFGKARLLKKIKAALNGHEFYYIGDESRDIEAAKETDMQSVAVTWGYQSESLLRNFKPAFLVHKPEELLEIANANLVKF